MREDPPSKGKVTEKKGDFFVFFFKGSGGPWGAGESFAELILHRIRSNLSALFCETLIIFKNE